MPDVSVVESQSWQSLLQGRLETSVGQTVAPGGNIHTCRTIQSHVCEQVQDHHKPITTTNAKHVHTSINFYCQKYHHIANRIYVLEQACIYHTEQNLTYDQWHHLAHFQCSFSQRKPFRGVSSNNCCRLSQYASWSYDLDSFTPSLQKTHNILACKFRTRCTFSRYKMLGYHPTRLNTNFCTC